MPPENSLGTTGKLEEPSDGWKTGEYRILDFGSLRIANYGVELLQRAKAAAAEKRKKQSFPAGNEGSSKNNRSAEEEFVKHVDPTLEKCNDTAESPIFSPGLPQTTLIEKAKPVPISEPDLPTPESIASDISSSEAPIIPVHSLTAPTPAPSQSKKEIPSKREVFCDPEIYEKRQSNVRSLIASFEHSKRSERKSDSSISTSCGELPKAISTLTAKCQKRMESMQTAEEQFAMMEGKDFLLHLLPEAPNCVECFDDQPNYEGALKRAKIQVAQFSPEHSSVPNELPAVSTSEDSTSECSSEQLDSEDESDLLTPENDETSSNSAESTPTSENDEMDISSADQNPMKKKFEDVSQQIVPESHPNGYTDNTNIDELDVCPDEHYIRVAPSEAVLEFLSDTPEAAMKTAVSSPKKDVDFLDQRIPEVGIEPATYQSCLSEDWSLYTSAGYPILHVSPEFSMKTPDQPKSAMNGSDEVRDQKEHLGDNATALNLNEFDQKAEPVVASEEYPKIWKLFENCLRTENVVESSSSQTSRSSVEVEDEPEESLHSAYGTVKSVSSDESVDENDDESRTDPTSSQNDSECSDEDESAKETLAETPEKIMEETIELIEENVTLSKLFGPLDESDENIKQQYGTIEEPKKDLPTEELSFSSKAMQALNFENLLFPIANSEKAPIDQSNSSKDENTFLINKSDFHLAPALHINTKQMFATSLPSQNEALEEKSTTSCDTNSSESSFPNKKLEWKVFESSFPPRKYGIQLDTEDKKRNVTRALEKFRKSSFVQPDSASSSDTSKESIDVHPNSSEDTAEMDKEKPLLSQDLGDGSKQTSIPESRIAHTVNHVEPVLDEMQLELQRRMEASLAQPRKAFEVTPQLILHHCTKRLQLQSFVRESIEPSSPTSSDDASATQRCEKQCENPLDIRRKHFEAVQSVNPEQKPHAKKLYVYKSSKVPVLPADIFKDRPSPEEWDSYYDEDSQLEQPMDHYQASVPETDSLLASEQYSDEYSGNCDVNYQCQCPDSQSLEVHCEDHPEYNHDDLWPTHEYLLDYLEQEDLYDGCTENDGKSRFYYLLAKVYNQGFGEQRLMSSIPIILAHVCDKDICYFGPNAKGERSRMRGLAMAVESQTASENACRPERMRVDTTGFHQAISRVFIMDSIEKLETIKTFSLCNKERLVEAVLQIEHYQVDALVHACQKAPKNSKEPLITTEIKERIYVGECFQQNDPMMSDMQTVEYSYEDEQMPMKNGSECFVPTVFVPLYDQFEYVPVEWVNEPIEYINEETALSRPSSAVQQVAMESVGETYTTHSHDVEHFMRTNNMVYQTLRENQRMDYTNETMHTHPIDESVSLFRSECREQHGTSMMDMRATVDHNNTSSLPEAWQNMENMNTFQSYCVVNTSGPTYYMNVSMPALPLHNSGVAFF